MKETPENFNWNEINSQPNSEESNIDSTTTEANDITPNDVYPEYDNPYYVQFVSEAEMFNHLFQLGNKQTPDSLDKEEQWKLFSHFLKKKADQYEEACEADDIGRILKVMSELLYTTGSYIMKHGLKRHIWEGFLELHQSQLTKSAPNAKIANESVKKYLKNNPNLTEEDIEVKQFGNRFCMKDKTIDRIIEPTTYRTPTFISLFTKEELSSPTVNYANKALFYGTQRAIREKNEDYLETILRDYEFKIPIADIKPLDTPSLTDLKSGEDVPVKEDFKVFIPEQNPTNRWEHLNNDVESSNLEDNLNFPQSSTQDETQDKTVDSPPKINWNNEWNFDNTTENNN